MQNKSEFRLAPVLVFLCLVLCFNQNVNGIINGRLITVDKVPFLVSLIQRGRFKCGGTLVAPDIVITAAHCVQESEPSDFHVMGGATFLSEAGARCAVSAIIIPTHWEKRYQHMDIAIMKLSSPMSGPNIRTIKLCDKAWTEGTMAKVSGWGQTYTGSFILDTLTSLPILLRSSQNQMQTVEVPLMSKDSCKKYYKGKHNITNSMFCAAKVEGRGFCFGDSGGPLTFGGRLCGVVSWGVACNETGGPGIYTGIRSVITFIEDAIKNLTMPALPTVPSV